ELSILGGPSLVCHGKPGSAQFDRPIRGFRGPIRALTMRNLPILVLIVLSISPTGSPAAEPAGGRSRAADGPRLALLVGVTRYQNFPSIALEGPANDLILIRQMLKERFGFQDPDIVTLSEADGAKDPTRSPTRANIEREMIALAKMVVEMKEAKVV